jgi:predicted Fe-Mo cluster-binding NifX family protein
MKIAIPVADGKLFGHFGHCPSFALIDTENETGKIIARNDVAAPPHEPGVLPVWLAGSGVELVLTGGIGPRAQDLLAQKGIKVVAGIAAKTPESLVADYYAGTLESGANSCTHEHV